MSTFYKDNEIVLKIPSSVNLKVTADMLLTLRTEYEGKLRTADSDGAKTLRVLIKYINLLSESLPRGVMRFDQEQYRVASSALGFLEYEMIRSQNSCQRMDIGSGRMLSDIPGNWATTLAQLKAVIDANKISLDIESMERYAVLVGAISQATVEKEGSITGMLRLLPEGIPSKDVTILKDEIGSYIRNIKTASEKLISKLGWDKATFSDKEVVNLFRMFHLTKTEALAMLHDEGSGGNVEDIENSVFSTSNGIEFTLDDLSQVSAVIYQ